MVRFWEYFGGKPTGFAYSSDMGCDRKRCIKDYLRFWATAIGRMKLPSTNKTEARAEAGLERKD